MLSFGEYAAFLTERAAACHGMLHLGVREVGKLAQTMAVEYVGREMPEWAPLSHATMEGFRHPYGFWVPGKIELGYTGHVSATDPLLRTGKMRDSIDVQVIDLRATLGSPYKVMLFQEMGTHNPLTGDIPPRPVLALAMKNSLEHAREVFGGIALACLVPNQVLLGRRLH